MGGAVMCQVAARRSDVRAVIVDSLYSRFFPILQRSIQDRYHLPAFPWSWFTWWCVQLGLGRRLSALDPGVLAPRLHQPLLAIQGGQDLRVLPSLAQEFYDRWAGSKERWFDSSGGHVGMLAKDPERYCARVDDFLTRIFGESSL
jgi:pimeloyl-ACP methyl ester carboxylesterase